MTNGSKKKKKKGKDAASVTASNSNSNGYAHDHSGKKGGKNASVNSGGSALLISGTASTARGYDSGSASLTTGGTATASSGSSSNAAAHAAAVASISLSRDEVFAQLSAMVSASILYPMNAHLLHYELHRLHADSQ